MKDRSSGSKQINRKLEQEKARRATAEQHLQNSQYLLQTLIDTIEGEVFVKDPNGVYLYVNRAFGENFGVDPEDVVGKDDFFVFSPETAKTLQENDRQIMADKKAVNIEESGIVRGKLVTYLTNKAPLIDDDGHVLCICGVGIDITQKKIIEAELKDTHRDLGKRIREIEAETDKRKQVEDALRKSQKQYQQLVEDLGEKFMIYSHRLDGTLTYASPGLETIFRLSRNDTIGSDWTNMIDWESMDLELARENIGNMVSGLEYQRMSMSFRHPDGKYRTIFISPHPIKNSAGEVVGVEGIVEDITERRQAEEALKNIHAELEKRVAERTAQLTETLDQLRETEWRYRTAADFTHSWEYWSNLDGSLQYVSPACERISGYAPEKFMQNPPLFSEIVLPEDLDIWKRHLNDSRQHPKVHEIQFRIQHRDGSIRWVEHVCQPVIGDQDEILGFRASNRDITRRKQGELRLQTAYSEIKALKAQLEADQTYLREEIKSGHDHENIIGDSDLLKYVLYRAKQIAPTDTTVLILGETGTGKELIARAIHNASLRRARPLIKVDCASLTANLIESELFGHEKGAFTGAVENRVGRFELADGATLFLDEIGELPLDLQAKLLRVIQDGEFERLGSSQTRRTDVRIIAATNRNLEDDIRNARFRMDLWYRLSVSTITMPPLREREDDIIILIDHMVKHFAKKHGKQIVSIPDLILSKLKDHPWPGNIRELENVIERAVIYTQGDMLQLDDVVVTPSHGAIEAADQPMKSLAEMEREHILRALRKSNWKIHGQDGAAALLDMNPSTLRGRMRKQRIHKPPYQAE